MKEGFQVELSTCVSSYVATLLTESTLSVLGDLNSLVAAKYNQPDGAPVSPLTVR